MTLTDVFFCMLEKPPLERALMASICLARWREIPGVALHLITEKKLGVTPFEFQRQRRIYADSFARSSEYIVADDDCLLPEDFDLNAALKIFKDSCFSVLCIMPSNATISEWTPVGYEPEITKDVMEHYAGGQVRFCLKGHIEHWPPMTPGWPGYDTLHGAAIRQAGGKIGYFRNIKALHLGEGKSTLWSSPKSA